MAPKYLNHVTKHYPFMTCIVKVNARSSWQKTVAKVLNKCHGVHSFRMDDNGLVEISGTVDPNLLLKILGEAGRKAELRWLQFGDCSSNLFVPLNHSGYGGQRYNGGTGYSRDGRYLHSGSLPRPKLPSHEALRSSAPNQKHDYQIVYDKRHDYDQHAHNYNQHYHQSYDHNHDYQLAYDQKYDYQQGYYHDQHYPQSYDYRHDYQHNDHRHDNHNQYNSSYRHDGNQTHYLPPSRPPGGEDVGCCRVM